MPSSTTKHFIIPGLAKAGTTFLYDSLIKNPEHFNIPIRKELNFFASPKQRSFAEYMGLFPENTPEKFFLDCSPVYLARDHSIAPRIAKNLAGRDVRFLVLLRNPVDMIVSHYYHDLKSNVARMQYLQNYDSFNFWAPDILSRYFKKQSKEIKLLKQAGFKQIFGMHQSDLIKPDAAQKISTFLGVPLKPFDTEHVSNPGGWLPYYVYGGSKGSFIEHAGKVYNVPPKALILVSNRRSEINLDVDESFARHAIDLQTTFSRKIRAHQSYFQAALDEYHAMCEVLDLSPQPLDLPEIINFVPKTPMITNEIANQLTLTKRTVPQ